MSETIYHAETDTHQQAEDAKEAHEASIKAAGGSIEIGYGRGSGAIVMVKLPAELNVLPENIMAGSGLRFSKVRAQVVQVPKDMGEDPRLRKEK